VTNPYRGSSGVGDTYTYDSLNRITRVTHADTSHSHADINYHQGTAQTCSAGTYGYGYSTVYTDEVGNQRQTFTDGLGRMIEVDEPNSSGTLNVNTCYKYDILGNLREVDQGSLTRMYTYDMLSRLTNATTPEAKGNTRHFDYTTSRGGLCAGDPNAVCRRTDERAVTTTYTYDNMNRLTGKSYPHDPSVTYYYNQASYNGLTIANKNGNRTGMSDAAGTTAWSYDSMGRVVTEKGTIASVTRTISYSYNKDGSLYSVTYPSGKTVTYDPNAVGRPTNAKDLVNGINYVTNATYSPQGTLASATFGSNITATYGYDSSRLWVNNIQAAKISPSTTFFSLQPAYNTNGTVSGVTNALNSDYTTSYTYDNLNRWITAKTTGIGIWGLAVPSGGYDRSGNLLQVNVTQGYAPGLNISVNAYNQITGWNYDSAGNVTSDGTYSYQWNDEGLLSNDGSINYTYDGLGRREVRYSGTNFWFNQAGQLLGATINGGTTLANEYIYFNGMRVAANVPTNTIYYYFGDQIGSLRTVTDSSGNVCYNGDYTPLGYRNNVSVR
jgi:YD repeat-containing protein